MTIPRQLKTALEAIYSPLGCQRKQEGWILRSLRLKIRWQEVGQSTGRN
jgi:hypothetical protein